MNSLLRSRRSSQQTGLNKPKFSNSSPQLRATSLPPSRMLGWHFLQQTSTQTSLQRGHSANGDTPSRRMILQQPARSSQTRQALDVRTAPV